MTGYLRVVTLALLATMAISVTAAPAMAAYEQIQYQWYGDDS